MSRFFGGGQDRREIIFRMWTVSSDSRKKKQCAMLLIASSFVAAKQSFSRRFAWSRRHKFLYLRNFDRSWSSRRCFWRRLRAVWAISGSRHQPRSRCRSISCERVNVNNPKLWNFDRPLGLPGHLQWSFYVGNVSSFWNATVRVRGNCRCRQPRNNSRDRADVNRRKSGRYTRYLRNFNGPLGSSGRCRQCVWCRQHVISSKNDGASLW